MHIAVFFDNNVWDFLFLRKLDLDVQLPRAEFPILITREAEFEIAAIPACKAELKAFIEGWIERRDIRTDPLFGFADESLPADEQRVGGWDQGRWADPIEIRFMAEQNAKPRSRKKKAKTRLYAHEADISLAARSLRFVVLTRDTKKALKDAHEQGGRVIYVDKFNPDTMTLGQFIKTELNLPE